MTDAEEQRARTTTPRIAPLEPSAWTQPLRLLLSFTPGGTARPMNIFTTLARSGPLFWAWLPFAGKLLAGELSARHRELAILRTASLCGCAYEAKHHRDIAKDAGFHDAELDALGRDPKVLSWAPSERLVIALCDELHDTNRVSDATWTALREHLDEPRLIELVMLVGHYHMVAFALNSLEVELEPSDTSAPTGTASITERLRRGLLKSRRPSR